MFWSMGLMLLVNVKVASLRAVIKDVPLFTAADIMAAMSAVAWQVEIEVKRHLTRASRHVILTNRVSVNIHDSIKLCDLHGENFCRRRRSMLSTWLWSTIE